MPQLTDEVYKIVDVQFGLFPGHEVAAAGEFGKVNQVDLARRPFTWQGRIVRAMGDRSRNSVTLARIPTSGSAHIFVIRASSRVNRLGHPVNHDIREQFIAAETRLNLLFSLLPAAAIAHEPGSKAHR